MIPTRSRHPALRRTLLAAAVRRLQRVRLVRRYLADGPRPLAFTSSTSHYIWLIHQDTYPATLGRWRLTTLNAADGTPWGHVVPDSFAACLREAAEDGADLSTPLALPMRTLSEASSGCRPPAVP